MKNAMSNKSPSVLGATDLLLLAPLKTGQIPALDARSYESRARLVLATLQALGISRREIDPTPAIDEVADAIRAIRSFRLAIVGQEQRQVLLSVSFDGGWEPYMRRIWRDLGPLLDLIFCNCEGYLLSRSHSYRAYAGWVRRAQVKTEFYYEDSPLTVSDLRLLADTSGLPTPAPAAPAASFHEQSRPALVALYRLTDMFPPQPGNEDGLVLRRAAHLLLGRLSRAVATTAAAPPGLLRTATERAAWQWFRAALPPPPDPPQPVSPDLANVQSGILEGYAGLAHGCLVLIGLDNAAAVRTLIDHLLPQIVSAAAPPYQMDRPLFVNLALTHSGLELAGVDPGTLAQLPPEFVEGMAARAGVLGDWQHNHPAHWTLPRRHGAGAPARVELSTVHAVVQLSLVGERTQQWAGMADPAKQPLEQAVGQLDAVLRAAGGCVLAVQPMQRYADGQGRTVGHFGFVDGLSQPGLAVAGRLPRDTVEPGDLLLGYPNGLKDPPLRGRLWDDSSFLVLRKLRQDVPALDALVPDPDARARLMGRQQDGTNLIDVTTVNDFDYGNDAQGQFCPLYAHVRRANPRAERPDLKHLPRLLRRGMSYGPPLNGGNAQDERGLMFMAYNASIAEQFEVVQGWLAGGNSSGDGSLSTQRDPFLGVARAGDPRCYAWTEPNGKRQSVVLPADRPLVTLEWGLYAFVPSLSALRELRRWAHEAALEVAIEDPDAPQPDPDLDRNDAAQRKRDRRNREEAGQAALGSALIARLRLLEQGAGFDAALDGWKLALEDLGARMTGRSQAIWTAIRKVHGGVLRTPYGVLVCSKSLVMQVFANAQQLYSATGYNTRLAHSFGEIYLGRDDGPAYRQEANPANGAILAVRRIDAYLSAYRLTREELQATTVGLRPGQDLTVEVKDLVDGLLVRFCREWFGLPDGVFVVDGGWHWRPDAIATCPGHFHAPSRYTFQPQPGDEARRVGEAHGQALKTWVLQFVRARRGDTGPRGRLGSALFAAFTDDDRLATTLIGVMMGFLPTVDGNLRGVLYEWISDRSLWQHQARLRAEGNPEAILSTAEAVLSQALDRTMQLRPVPEVVWRTVLQPHVLGAGPAAVELRAGDTVVLSIVSAMQQDRLAERRDPFVVFGGQRTSFAQPPHACPGYEMAIGVMLGFLAALMEVVTLRPASSPMALRIGPP